MTDRLRAGIVGAGFMGQVHARAVRAAGGMVARVAASTPERAAAAAAQLGAERSVDSAEALVSADDVDVVHICTPNALHAPLAKLALGAGKPVVCEKPLATSVEDARELTAQAAATALVATVPFVYRFYPTVREARARIAPGRPGPCACSTAPTCRTGSPDPPTATGGSTPNSAGPRGPLATSACTGATSWSSPPGTASPGSPPAPSPHSINARTAHNRRRSGPRMPPRSCSRPTRVPPAPS